MAKRKIHTNGGKSKPKLYVKKRRFNISPIVLISIVAIVIMLGSVLGSIQFAKEEPEEQEGPEPEVPLVPQIEESKFRTDLEIESLLNNYTYFIRIVDFPTTQLSIDLNRIGRRENLEVERIIYPKDCTETRDPSIAQICPEDQTLLPIVAIYRPGKTTITFSGRKTLTEVEELMNGTIIPTVYFYQDECEICPKIFNPFLLSLPGTVNFEILNKTAFEKYGMDLYPTFVFFVDDLIFLDFTQNLNLFILENRANVSFRQTDKEILMTSNPTATSTKECNETLHHFYSEDCGECIGYSSCEVFLNETNTTTTEIYVGEKKRGCEYTEGIRQILKNYTEIEYEEVCVGPACDVSNETAILNSLKASKYGVQSVPTLIYNCKYREEGFQENQEERIVRFYSALNPDLNLTLGEDLSNVTISSDTNSTLLTNSSGEE